MAARDDLLLDHVDQRAGLQAALGHHLLVGFTPGPVRATTAAAGPGFSGDLSSPAVRALLDLAQDQQIAQAVVHQVDQYPGAWAVRTLAAMTFSTACCALCSFSWPCSIRTTRSTLRDRARSCWVTSFLFFQGGIKYRVVSVVVGNNLVDDLGDAAFQCLVGKVGGSGQLRQLIQGGPAGWRDRGKVRVQQREFGQRDVQVPSVGLRSVLRSSCDLIVPNRLSTRSS